MVQSSLIRKRRVPRRTRHGGSGPTESMPMTEPRPRPRYFSSQATPHLYIPRPAQSSSKTKDASSFPGLRRCAVCGSCISPYNSPKPESRVQPPTNRMIGLGRCRIKGHEDEQERVRCPSRARRAFSPTHSLALAESPLCTTDILPSPCRPLSLSKSRMD